MKLTLWLLNRCVEWEERYPGVQPKALAAAGPHQVALGKRCVSDSGSTAPGSGDPSVPIECVAVNDKLDSPTGALMHEGGPRDTPSYDEYFVPIPVKCIGDPWRVGGVDYVDFWEDELRADARTTFARIVDPRPANSYFHPGNLDMYWRVKDPTRASKPRTKRVAVAPDAPSAFGDVQVNTRSRRGYYQILRDHTTATGRKNVLVGYSQGGLVARYLAFLDEYVSRRDPCIHGIVTAQAPLRGSPVAAAQNADFIARALTTLAISIGHAQSSEETIARAMGHAATQLTTGPSTFLALALLLDSLIHVNEASKESGPLLDIVRTARKWISGLTGDPELAFHDLDPARLEDPGAVLESVATHPMTVAWHGAVIGADFRLEELVRGLVAGSCLLRLGEAIWRQKIAGRLARGEMIYRSDVMDVGGGRAHPLAPPALEQLRVDMANPAGLSVDPSPLPANAHDFVIPSASQVMLDTGDLFLGNHVNEDASHLSGARLETRPFTDLDLVCRILKRMSSR
jgi:hypothetical protein